MAVDLGDAAGVCAVDGEPWVCFTRDAFVGLTKYISSLIDWSQSTWEICKE